MRHVDKDVREATYKSITCPTCFGSGLYDYGIKREKGYDGFAVCWDCHGTGVLVK